jgi:hypothetical protein
MANPGQYLPESHPLVNERGYVTRPWFLAFFQQVAKILVSVGNVFGPTTATLDNQIALFDGTTGVQLKAASGTGFVEATNGVYGVFTLVQNRLLGRGASSGNGTPEAIELGTGLTLTGTTLSASGAGGTVTTTGSPANGNLTKFSGTTSVTNGDLSGDVTTSGTLAATLANSGVTAGTYGTATKVAQVTVDAKGRVTTATEVTIAGIAGTAWSLVTSAALSGAASYDVTNLDGYTDLRVFFIDVTFGSASETEVVVSTDNGSTFLTASGDYRAIAGNGALSNNTRLQPYAGAATAARGGEILIEGFNLTAPKVARSLFFSVDSVYMRFVPVASALNAIRIKNSAAVNFTGGTYYVYGR